jgi:hypothetical protein
LRIRRRDPEHQSNNFTTTVASVGVPCPAFDVIARQIRASTVDRHDGTAYSPAYTDSNAVY